MATGIPRKTRSSGNGKKPHLSYEGKAEEQNILSTPPAEAHVVWGARSMSKNRLYWGDNLPLLARLLRDGDILGNVRLVYIDPPFATQSTFLSRKQRHAYEDVLSGADFIESLRMRLVLLRELLSADGSIYIHLDEKMVFHVKVLMDELFGEENYRNCITRKKCSSKNYTRKSYGNVADYILFYTKSSEYVWNRPFEPWTDARAKEYQYVEESTGRRFMKVPLHAPGERNGETGKAWRGLRPPPGKHWQYPPSKLDAMDSRGEIYWSANGNPRRKVYLDENPGVGVHDIWLGFRDAHNQNIRITGYPTEKNPALLSRIISASSNPGDRVLDCFCGSGTTLACADQLGRRWVGIDNSREAICTTLGRFAAGTELMGDYVKAEPEKAHAGRVTPSLFDSADEVEHAGDAVEHRPITDFEFLAVQENLIEAKGMIDEWVRSLPTAIDFANTCATVPRTAERL